MSTHANLKCNKLNKILQDLKHARNLRLSMEGKAALWPHSKDDHMEGSWDCVEKEKRRLFQLCAIYLGFFNAFLRITDKFNSFFILGRNQSYDTMIFLIFTIFPEISSLQNLHLTEAKNFLYCFYKNVRERITFSKYWFASVTFMVFNYFAACTVDCSTSRTSNSIFLKLGNEKILA